MKKGNISLVGVGSNSPFHTEQVVNNEGSAMVSSVGAIWRKSGATLLLTQGEEALTGADGRRLAAFTRSPLSFKDAAVRLTCRLGVNKKTCSLQGNRRFGGRGAWGWWWWWPVLKDKRTPQSPPLPCSYMEGSEEENTSVVKRRRC